MMHITQKIKSIKEKMGNDLCILAHHYQRDEIVQHADFIGDSLELARKIEGLNAKYIVMCGVYFMAETSAILAREDQKVFIPVYNAGCTLADLAPATLVEMVLTKLNQKRKIIPIAYVNTSAKVKAICGRFGGSVCTSANSVTMLRWALDNSDGVLFLPDRHLGINSANALNLKKEDISFLEGDLFEKDYKLYLWPGLCDVHQNFRPEHIKMARKQHPEAKVIVHPECPEDVVELADEWGSTSKIITYVKQLPKGSQIVIGTEINLVNRLKKYHEGEKEIYYLINSSCKHMATITEDNLFMLLDSLEKTKPVEVDKETKKFARLAIEKMLSLCNK